MTTDSSEGLAIISYFAVIRRWKWLVIGITLACLVGSMGYSVTRTALYRATVKLLYVRPVTISNPLVHFSYSDTSQQPDIATVSAMVTSDQVASKTDELLRPSKPC